MIPIETITITVSKKAGSGLVISSDRIGAGTQYDSGETGFLLVRPEEYAGDNAVWLLSDGVSDFEPYGTGTENTFLITNAYTRRNTLKLQLAFERDGESVVHSNILRFNLRASLPKGAAPAEPFPLPPKGADGVSPQITVKTDTADTYILTITTAGGSFDTPNLRGGAVPSEPELALPEYIEAVMTPFADAVNADRRPDSTVFLCIADTHAGSNDIRRFEGVKAMAAAESKLHPDFCVHLGDWAADSRTGAGTSPYPGNTRYLSFIDEQVKILSAVKTPFFGVFGNHDLGLADGSTVERRVFPRDFFAHAERPFQGNHLNVHNEDPEETDKPYYYYDFPGKKLRVIVLCTNDLPVDHSPTGSVGWGAKQIKWLGEIALQLPESEWGVIFFAHVPPMNILLYTADGEYPTLHNESAFTGVVKAFTTGGAYTQTMSGTFGSATVNADFTARGEGRVICYVHGHIHADNIQRPDNLPFVPVSFAANLSGQREADILPEGSVSPARNSGSIEYICWQACVYHPEDFTLHVFRMGMPTTVFNAGGAGDPASFPVNVVQLSSDLIPVVSRFWVQPEVLGHEGGVVTVHVSGMYLHKADSLSVEFNGTELSFSDISNTSASLILEAPANTGSEDATHAVRLKVNGNETQYSADVTVRHELSGAPAYALRLQNGARGTLPFGNGLPASSLSRVSVGMKFNDLEMPSSGDNIYFIYSSSGSNQRGYVGIEYRKRPTIGWGSASSVTSGGKTVLEAGKIYDIELQIGESGQCAVLVDGNEDVVTASDGDFAFASNFYMGYKSSGFTGDSDIVLYYMRFYDRQGNLYADYDFQQDGGDVVLDTSGNGRHIPLDARGGYYSWVSV